MARVNRTRFAVLGALSIGPRSGYEVKQDLESTVGFFWKESFGQIYPILRGLVDDGLATVQDQPQGGRSRKVYSITAEGQRAFVAWLRTPPDPMPARNELLLKLFFCRQAGSDVAIAHLERAASEARAMLAAFEAVDAELQAEREHNPDYDYFMVTLRSGQLAREALLKWCSESIERLQRLARQA